MPQHTKAERKKNKKDSSFRESVRKFLTIFNPGATAIERKITPEIDKATAVAKKR